MNPERQKPDSSRADKQTAGQPVLSNLMKFHFLEWKALPLSECGQGLPLQCLHHSAPSSE